MPENKYIDAAIRAAWGSLPKLMRWADIPESDKSDMRYEQRAAILAIANAVRENGFEPMLPRLTLQNEVFCKTLEALTEVNHTGKRK